MRAALALWLGWAALAALLARRVWEDVTQPVFCDTTYLWQGYEPALAVDGNGYSLVKFADADPHRAAGGQGLGWLGGKAGVLPRPATSTQADPQPCLEVTATLASPLPLASPAQPTASCSSSTWCPSCSCTATWAHTSRCGRRQQRRGGSWPAGLRPTEAGRCGCSGTELTLAPRHLHSTQTCW